MLPANPGAVETAWRQLVGARDRTAHLDYFVGLSKTGDAAQKTLSLAILLQSVRGPLAQQAIRDKVQPVLTAGWTDAANAPNLARAVRIMKLESQYAEQLKSVPNPYVIITLLSLSIHYVRRFRHFDRFQRFCE
ncbi:MAG: hypothetical protein ABJB74_18575 [Gemmatimonas sp.]